MDINADFSQRVALHGTQMPWVDSPIAGVQRRMLDRIGAEVARATSIVRYAAGSSFTPHTHSGGEEFIVLEGVFQDEHGDYPAGTYIRNPPTSRHTPRSADGCVIFVKLWQFDLNDRTRVIVDLNKIGSVISAEQPGVAVTPLFLDTHETVQVETWQAHTEVNYHFTEGAELLVLAGDFNQSGQRFERMSWLRLPCGAQLTATAGAAGAKVWVKMRHLRFIQAPPASS
jgi:anti-sigma factor ChrR (cupin superfamily)